MPDAKLLLQAILPIVTTEATPDENIAPVVFGASREMGEAHYVAVGKQNDRGVDSLAALPLSAWELRVAQGSHYEVGVGVAEVTANPRAHTL